MAKNSKLSKGKPFDVIRKYLQRDKKGTLALKSHNCHTFYYVATDKLDLLGVDKDVWDLETLLRKRGFVTDDQLERAHKIMESSGKNFREILINQGFLADNEIKQAIRIQIYEEIFEPFLDSECEFKFYEEDLSGDLDENLKPPFRISFDETTILDAAKHRREKYKNFKTSISNPEAVYKVVSDEIPDGDDPVENALISQILEELQKNRCVRDLYENQIYSRFEVYKIIYKLLKAGTIEVPPAGELLENAKFESDNENYQSAMNLYRLFLNQEDREEVYEEYAKTLEKGDKKKTASRIYVKAAKWEKEQGNLEKAANLLSKACETDPKNENAMTTYFDILIDLGDKSILREKGINLLEKLEENGNTREANRLLSRLIDRFPNDLELHLLGVRIASKDQNRSRTEQHLERAYHLITGQKGGTLESARERLMEFAGESERLQRRVEDLIEQKKKSQKKKTGSRVLVASIAVLAVLAFFGGRYQLNSKEAYDRIQSKATQLVEEGNRKEAVEEYKTFLNRYPYSYLSGTVEGNISDLKQQIKSAREKRERKKEELSKDLAALEAKVNSNYAGDNGSTRNLIQKLNALQTRGKELDHASVIEKTGNLIKTLEKREQTAQNMKEKAHQLLEDGDFKKARKLLLDLRNQYGRTKAAQQIQYPVRITSSPSGARVRQNGKNLGTTPLVITMSPKQESKIILSKDSYSSKTITILPESDDEIHANLSKKIEWTTDLGSSIKERPAAIGNTLTVVSDAGKIWTGTTSNRVKKIQVKEKLAGLKYSPLIVGSNIVLQTEDGILGSYSTKQTKVDWMVKLKKKQYFPPSRNRSGNLIFVPVVPDGVMILSASDGSLKHAIKLNNHPATRVISCQNNYYLITADRLVHRIDETKGKLVTRDRFKLDGIPVGTPVSNSNYIWMGLDNQKLVRIEPVKQDIKVLAEFPSPVKYGPILQNQKLLCVTQNNVVHLMEAESGNTVWTRELPYQPAASPAMDSRFVFISGRDKTIRAYRRTTGKKFWQIKLDDISRSGILVRSKYICFGTDSGYLYLIRK